MATLNNNTTIDPALDPDLTRDDQDRKTEEDSDNEVSELKRAVKENAHMDLRNLAQIVRSEEQGPNSERFRNVFGTHWLTRSCESLSDVAVPRNRIYAQYVGVCAQESLKPLNPASFGKLVRTVFPEIRTRRLGVRGQSKYHYCGVRLKGDESSPRSNSVLKPSPTGFLKLANGGLDMFLQANTTESSACAHSQNVDPVLDSMSSAIGESHRLSPRLVYSKDFLVRDRSVPGTFVLPDILPFVPEGASDYRVTQLIQLYEEYSNTLIEALASMRIKQFLSQTALFYASLTADLREFISSPSLSLWVQSADLQMYKHIARMLSPLTFQVVPPEVVSLLRNLSATLVSHVHSAFMPYHVPNLLRAKLIPAGQFSSLLFRMLRVNETAHAAARFLTNPADRELMRLDWLRYVDAKAIVQRELTCGEEQVTMILDEVLSLLGSGKYKSNDSTPGEANIGDSVTKTQAESGLDLWKNFLANLPHRFPDVEPRLFLLCMGSIESAILREITVNGGEGFGALWVVRCWVDEWMRFYGEQGAFLASSIDLDKDDDETQDSEWI